jgi:NADPH-dependent curcumin reductase CurA
MRGMMNGEYVWFANQFPLGATVKGFAVEKVVESTISQDKKYDLVQGFLDWADYSVWENIPDFPVSGLKPVNPSIKKLSYALGVLDIVGLTAYFGIQEISKPKPGETILISSAAGGVGSIAGQIAKIQGAKVIGLTTTKEKLDTLVNKLGFDAALDYKSPDFANELKNLIPGGPDIYFDNVGGGLSQIIMNQMRRPARVLNVVK